MGGAICFGWLALTFLQVRPWRDCVIKNTHALPQRIAALGVAPKILTDPDAWFNTVRFAKERDDVYLTYLKKQGGTGSFTHL